MSTILVSGFDGFAGHDRNPSWEAIKNLPATYGTVKIVTVKLPVEYDTAASVLQAKVREVNPDAIVSFGLAGGESYLRVEQRGYNYRGGIADNAGKTPKGLILATEAATVGSVATIDPQRVVAWATPGKIEAQVSTNAGDYICNEIAYTTPQAFPHIPFVFIHTMALLGDAQYAATYKKVALEDLILSLIHI